jgi:hypothetical protein
VCHWGVSRETGARWKRTVCHLAPERQHRERVMDQCKDPDQLLQVPAEAPSPSSTPPSRASVPVSTLGSLLYQAEG